MNICYVVGAAPTCADFTPRAGDAVVAADGGAAHLRARGIVPDLVLGDFDSSVRPTDGAVAVYPPEKDDTDTMLALKWGWAQGYRRFRLLGGTGGRADHTMANVQALAWLAARGGRGVLVAPDACATVVRAGTLRFRARSDGTLSVFAYGGEAHGVTLTGLYYQLWDGSLSPDFPLGVSNHFIGEPVSVRVKSGALLVYWSGVPDELSDE